ncbi:conjugative transfer protein TraE, partial [Salmonella enterica subsp. enterica serovar Beaudesert]|nr:conjugative transfer protein TraE [Salmonella enterica subsp. enterica serovar Beaudesert]
MNEGWTRALPFILAGSCLIKLDEITQSLGATIF